MVQLMSICSKTLLIIFLNNIRVYIYNTITTMFTENTNRRSMQSYIRRCFRPYNLFSFTAFALGLLFKL